MPYHTAVENLWPNYSDFRQIYISLTKDWSVNKSIVRKLIMPRKSDKFYEENPVYYAEAYQDYTTLSVLVYDASQYLSKVKNFAGDIMWILVAAGSVGLILFTYMSVKKHNYKIGVLKSLGTKNMDITLIFGLQLVFMALLAFVLSIPASLIIMKNINAGFAKGAAADMVFFALTPSSLLWVLAAAVGLTVLSSLIPLIKLSLAQPISIIRQNKK